MLADNDYLTRIGRLSYLVSYLEWQVLGDLPHLPVPSLPELELTRLVDGTTDRLAQTFSSPRLLDQITDIPTREWLRRAGELLESAARDRDSVLHAHPATVDGRTVLHRWHPTKGEVFTVDDAWLDAAEQRVRDAISELARTRVARIQPSPRAVTDCQP
ncbi:hypothetical protein [Kitasatospora sp. NPDC056531]|uniref:hypothetical protein n=1 Tax=Kitasatospora sp. NPDC056531 TaxID=3345856 RepID=UPI00369B0F60